MHAGGGKHPAVLLGDLRQIRRCMAEGARHGTVAGGFGAVTARAIRLEEFSSVSRSRSAGVSLPGVTADREHETNIPSVTADQPPDAASFDSAVRCRMLFMRRSDTGWARRVPVESGAICGRAAPEGFEWQVIYPATRENFRSAQEVRGSGPWNQGQPTPEPTGQ